MTNETKATGKAKSKTTKAKKAGIPAMQFVQAVMAGRTSGKSNADIAKGLGMDADSFGVRLSNTNRDLRNATATYKVGEQTFNGEELARKYKLKIQDLHKPETLTAIGAEIVKAGRVIPGSESAPRVRTNWSAMAASLFGEDAPAAESGESDETGEDETAE
jgi:hypothetical protein